MEIQVTKGIFPPRAHLVLYVDLEKHPSGTDTFTSALYQTASQDSTTTDGQNPLLYCCGTGIEDQQDAFAFTDLLLQFNDLPLCCLEMASWVFNCETRPPGRYQVRYKISDQVAYIQTPGIAEFRILPEHEQQRPKLVSVNDC